MQIRKMPVLEADIVRCKMIEMRDNSGSTRLLLSIKEDGTPGFRLTSANSEAAFHIGFNDQGGIDLTHIAPNGRKTCVAQIAEDGTIPATLPPPGEPII